MKRKRCATLLLFALGAACALCAEDAGEAQKAEARPLARFLAHCSADFCVGAGTVSDWTHEYVYYEDGEVMSRLDWTSYAAPVVALSGEVSAFHAVLGAGFRIAVPVRCGTMEDWDYLGYDTGRATNYSKSDLIMNKNYALEVSAGYEFLLRGFRILPAAGFSYRNKKLEASGGYLQYGSLDESNGGYWSEGLKKYDLAGTVITYEQQFFMPFLSLQAEYAFCGNWRAKVFGRWSPSVRCDAIDMHNERMTQFNDFMEGGHGFSLGTEIQYKRVSLSLSYAYAECTDGESSQRNFGHTTYLSDSDSKPGTKEKTVTVLVTYHIR